MKRISLFLIFVTIGFCTSSVLAVDAITGFGVGTVLQKDNYGQIGVEIDVDFPVITTDKRGYNIVASTALMFVDRGFETTDEFQAIKTMVAYQKPLGIGNFFIETKGGLWFINDSEKEDPRLEAFGIALGLVEWGVELKLGAEFVPVTGPNIWYPYLKFNLLKL